MKRRGRPCSVVIAAGNEKTINALHSALRDLRFPEDLQITHVLTMTQLRRKAAPSVGGLSADILIVSLPLKDESGIDNLLDLAVRNDHVQILLLVRQEALEQTSYRCRNLSIFVHSTPVKRSMLTEVVQYMAAMRRRVTDCEEELVRLRRNLNDIGVITRAKFILAAQRQMTEEEAHHYLEREAMNSGMTKKEVAAEIIRKAESE